MAEPPRGDDPGASDHHAQLVPATPRQVAETEDIADGEIVDETEYQARGRLERIQNHQIVILVVTVATHRHTTTAAKLAARHTLYVPIGAAVVARRLWDAHTNSLYVRLLRAAEAAHDWDKLGEWEQRAEQAKDRRHRRRMDLLEMPARLAKAGAILLATLATVLALTGLVLMTAAKTPTAFLRPFEAVLSVAQALAWVVAIAWGPLILAAPWLLVLALWWVGRRTGTAPAWTQTAGAATADAIVVDERAIALALANLRVAAINQYFKAGGLLTFVTMPHRDGDLGVAAEVRLPPGAHAGDIIRQRKRLAANLGRASVETWPSAGDDEGVLALWVADRGALDAGAGEWPLLESRQPVDLQVGVPVGVTLRGHLVIAPIDGTSWLIGGRPGQGKTNFARLLVMGACLDPTAEIWVFVLADNADFDPLAERFTRYQVGMANPVAEAALLALDDLLAEIEHRGQVMREKGKKTAAEAGFHLLIAVFDEVHRLFQHRDYGKDASTVAEDVVKQARKYGIILILITQSPTATSIPKAVTREVICRVAFSVIDQIGNDALLGSGTYKQGIRATELRPGTKSTPGDRGKALTVGVVPESDWELIRAFQVEDGGVFAVADLARDLRRDHGRQVDAEAGPRDLLADLDEVLVGDGLVPSADVPALLSRLAPRSRYYRSLTGVALRKVLADQYGIRIPSTKNRWPLDPKLVREALARRDVGEVTDRVRPAITG